jgi:CheY-like chemotaxis protein
MSGFEASAAIRAREATRGTSRVPILALTAHVDRDTRRRCAESGMDACLAKPFTLGELQEALARVGAAR